MSAKVIFKCVIVIIGACLIKCNGDAVGSFVREQCPYVDTLKVSEGSVEKVDVFMETSGSMSVLMPGNNKKVTSFQKVVPNVLLRLEQSAPTEFYSIPNSSRAIKKIDSKLAGTFINSGKFVWGATTSIPAMLDTIQTYQTAKSVTVFITDAIFSPGKGATKDTAQAINLISERFNRIRSGNLATCIISSRSELGIEGTPYYMIIIGSMSNVNLVKQLVIEALDLYNQDFFEIVIGAPVKSPYYSVVPYFENSGNWIAEQCAENRFLLLTDLDTSSSPVEFWLSLDLSGFPAYVRDLKYLDTNLKTEFINSSGRVLTIQTDLGSVDAIDKPIVQKATHFIKVRVDEVLTTKAELQISIKYARPEWISVFTGTQENDRSTTAGFQNIITGIEDAYKYYKAEQYFLKDLPIILLRND